MPSSLLYEMINPKTGKGTFVPFAEVARSFNYEDIALGPRVIVDRTKMTSRKLSERDKKRISARADAISRSV